MFAEDYWTTHPFVEGGNKGLGSPLILKRTEKGASRSSGPSEVTLTTVTMPSTHPSTMLSVNSNKMPWISSILA